jgi:hypothetical protein
MKKMAPQAGFEPATLRLTAGCSAVELLRNLGGKPSRRAARARAGPAMVLNDRRNRQRSAASTSPVMRAAERDCGLRRPVPCTSVYYRVGTYPWARTSSRLRRTDAAATAKPDTKSIRRSQRSRSDGYTPPTIVRETLHRSITRHLIVGPRARRRARTTHQPANAGRLYARQPTLASTVICIVPR